jgi:predicted ATPase
VGANGAGKSNLIGFFKLIQQLIVGNLQTHISREGGPDALLHYGRKSTSRIRVRLTFGSESGSYGFSLEPTADNRMMFTDETFGWSKGRQTIGGTIGTGHFETKLPDGNGDIFDHFVRPALRSWVVYHFQDTGDAAPVKQPHALNDNAYLRPDASNLAAYLYLLQKTSRAHYQRIVRTIQLAAPFFGDFQLRPNPLNNDVIELEWVERGKDLPFKAHVLSDGTLRFICLATLLLQPAERRPTTVVIDEPELGLHPYAITVLASMLKSAASGSQIVVSTQSVELVNEFDAEDLLVVDRQQGRSIFSRLNERALSEWLDEYSLGELWKKNLIGGRPAR